MFERFTSRARAIVVLAQVEARAFNHNYIGTEHLLLGLIKEGEGVAVQALQALGVNLETIRQQVEEKIDAGTQARAASGHIPFTPRAKKVLEFSLREALQLGHNYIGTEHILLGLIREDDGVAAQVLLGLGADHDRTRAEVIHLLVGRESAERVAGGEGRSSRRTRAASLAQRAHSIRMPTARMAGAGDVSVLDALEGISERLGAIEARLGIPAPGREDLEHEVVRLTALLREHGIDPDTERAAHPAAAVHPAAAAQPGEPGEPGTGPESGQDAEVRDDLESS